MTSGQNANFRNGYQYRFVVQNDPALSGLVSCVLNDVSATVPVEDYCEFAWFTVGNSCSADFDGNGTVDLQDLNDVLAQFGVPQMPPINVREDTNADGVVDLADLNAVLGSFGSLCCTPAPLGGGTGNAIAQSMGYTCVDGFCSAVSAMTPAERDAAFDDLMEEAAQW